MLMDLGSLVLPLSDEDPAVTPALVYATVNGSLGIIGKVSEKHEVLLAKLEKSMEKRVKSVGGLDHHQ